MADFILPSFLNGRSVDDFYNYMREQLPPDIDSSEGSHVWNFLRPTAIVAAELCQAVLPGVIRTIFPEWSQGEFLDAHAQARGLSRRQAVAASVTLSLSGEEGRLIPGGARFSTAGTTETPAVEYALTDAVTLDSDGEAAAEAVCTVGGVIGNTPAGTIILSADGRIGVSVTNAAPATGGVDRETDESLAARLVDYDRSRGVSFAGTAADYQRWAMEASDEVGGVYVSSTTPGTVTLQITDRSGSPVSSALRQTVYDYIMSPDAPLERLAPVNASLIVTTPTVVSIYVSATVRYEAAGMLARIKSTFLSKLQEYLPEAAADGEVRMSKVGALLSGIDGCADYSELKIGRSSASLGTSNISLTSGEIPTTDADKVSLESGSIFLF